ncbi:hypothetical protein WSS15_29930 [Acetobacter pasteurianus]|uniref:hypothetical protein n=1 Tax=Acetobacter pasteurianus TaxID=438 RepID=UPI0022CAA6BC|nr:hypothetical protein [Acetobacter pasteurianus]GLH30343.1 hypothetical protein WSS15_29930 [Acetobacter pasteurianus]
MMYFDDPFFIKTIDDFRQRTSNFTSEMKAIQFEQEVAPLLDQRFNHITRFVPEFVTGRHIIDNPIGASDPLRPFNAFSLGNWLILAEIARVPTIPSRIISVVPTNSIISRYGNSISPEHKSAQDKLDKALEALKDDEILRYDSASAACLKAMMQAGEDDITLRRGVCVKPGGGMMPLIYHPHMIKHDERVAEATMTYCQEETPVWARTWIPAMRIEKKDGNTSPVEWRIYVMNGRIEGASLYYPHAPITIEQARTTYSLNACIEMARKILATMRGHRLFPHVPKYVYHEHKIDLRDIHCTLDFLVTESGDPVFLEGGPAHLRQPDLGAHPCNFAMFPPRGVALGEGVIAYEPPDVSELPLAPILPPREWVFRQQPSAFGLRCPNHPDAEAQWSEYRSHIWCEDCQKDIPMDDPTFRTHPNTDLSALNMFTGETR